MEAPATKANQKRPFDFCSGGGCCLGVFLLLLTGFVTSITAVFLGGLWQSHAYAGVRFYHSSESRGAFHIAFDAFVLAVCPCTLYAAIFTVRALRRSDPVTWRQAAAFFSGFAVVWALATIITFLLTVFYELPNWEVDKG